MWKQYQTLPTLHFALSATTTVSNIILLCPRHSIYGIFVIAVQLGIRQMSRFWENRAGRDAVAALGLWWAAASRPWKGQGTGSILEPVEVVRSCLPSQIGPRQAGYRHPSWRLSASVILGHVKLTRPTITTTKSSGFLGNQPLLPQLVRTTENNSYFSCQSRWGLVTRKSKSAQIQHDIKQNIPPVTLFSFLSIFLFLESNKCITHTPFNIFWDRLAANSLCRLTLEFWSSPLYLLSVRIRGMQHYTWLRSCCPSSPWLSACWTGTLPSAPQPFFFFFFLC